MVIVVAAATHGDFRRLERSRDYAEAEVRQYRIWLDAEMADNARLKAETHTLRMELISDMAALAALTNRAELRIDFGVQKRGVK
jgi:hypothetical protein